MLQNREKCGFYVQNEGYFPIFGIWVLKMDKKWVKMVPGVGIYANWAKIDPKIPIFGGIYGKMWWNVSKMSDICPYLGRIVTICVQNDLFVSIFAEKCPNLVHIWVICVENDPFYPIFVNYCAFYAQNSRKTPPNPPYMQNWSKIGCFLNKKWLFWAILTHFWAFSSNILQKVSKFVQHFHISSKHFALTPLRW